MSSSKSFRLLLVVLATALAASASVRGGRAVAATAETVGSPVRSASTILFEGRVDPEGSPASYWFEYGNAGPCGANPCAATPPQSAGSGVAVRFVSWRVDGLEPGMTYHYRLVVEAAAGPIPGESRVARTRADDQPLDHGPFPGPPGSDRAWEQVNVPDTGGNPVATGYSFSDSGERAVYQILGGTPISDSGSAYNQFFAERTAAGWLSRQILPPRSEVTGANWQPPYASDDLSLLFSENADFGSGARSFWRLRPEGAPTRLLDASVADLSGFYAASDDGSRAVAALRGSVDPAWPLLGSAFNIYDVGVEPPRLLSLLPSQEPPPCGVGGSETAFDLPAPARRVSHWLSPDGSLLFFPSRGGDCGGASQLYMRDIPAAATIRLSGPPLSGPSCGAGFVKSTPGAAFFWSRSRLVAEDSAAADCSGTEDGDVYRYDLAEEDVECVTCSVPGLDADVEMATGRARGPGETVAVAEDGSRVYFSTNRLLLPGAASPAAYRVDVETGDLAYVAPLDPGDTVGDFVLNGNALSPDGSVLVFRSAAAGLNHLNGPQNGGTAQYYLYDDRDRSLACVSCPADGSPAPAAAVDVLASPLSGGEIGPNADPLSDHGDFVFSTPSPLLPADRNTASPGADPNGGIDLYEWRDGRLLLVSDGLTTWPDLWVAPLPNGVSPSGRDVFFTASARYTPDAPDAYNRLYDARIGGGFDFDPAPPSCLGDCSASPLPLLEVPAANTDAFTGPGNVKPRAGKRRRCRKGMRRVRRLGKVRCVKPSRRHPGRR